MGCRVWGVRSGVRGVECRDMAVGVGKEWIGWWIGRRGAGSWAMGVGFPGECPGCGSARCGVVGSGV